MADEPRPTVSLCVIVRDEADLLPGCLASVRGAVDEVVVVDTGSLDDTVAIAQATGAQVAHHPWADDFAAARNAALALATGDWILVLDADEQLAPGAAAVLREAVRQPGIDCVFVVLHDADRVDAQPEDVVAGRARLCPPVLLPRLLRRTPDLAWEGSVHELPTSWLQARVDRCAPSAIDVVHLGSVPALRAARGKDERNQRLLEVWCRGHPDDHRALAYLGSALANVGDLEGAEAVAERAWQALCRDLDAPGPPPAVVDVVTLRAGLQARRGDPHAVEATLHAVAERAGLHREIAHDLGHPNLVFLGGYAHEALAPFEATTARRLDRLQTAAAAYGRLLDLAGTITTSSVLDGVTDWRAHLRLGTTQVQLGQAEPALRHLHLARQAGTGTAEVDLAIVEAGVILGQADDVLEELVPRLDREGPDAWVLAACAARLACRHDLVPALVRGAEQRAHEPWVATHRTLLFEQLAAEPHDPRPPVVFIGGAGRSGTTLLRVMLDAHPGMSCGPETKLVPELGAFRDEFVDRHAVALLDAGIDVAAVDQACRAFLDTLLSGLARPGVRLAEKTPHNVLHTALLARLMPRARFIHVVRDGRAVVASLFRQGWVDPVTGSRPAYCEDARSAALYWKECVLQGRFQAACALGRAVEARYEDLVTAPEATMRRLLAFLDEPWDPAVLDHAAHRAVLPASETSSERAAQPVDTSSLDRWRIELDADQLAQVDEAAGDALDLLGYRRSGDGHG